ncbi:hypothetical protein [Gelidibacter salicanalis]|uniref:Uncharacterized protein n=1 Tax=Gelidibacter salicanalis TaxID=291193 RepID=A0A934KUZ4_9FLAO|nr:hypothetical protein [Gelidibacter salicanalis]MBJ7881142.1 hypothetical protein [Gelidibacter salicanalis]
MEAYFAGEFLRLSYYGLAFDNDAILYVNILLILLSIVPLNVTTPDLGTVSSYSMHFLKNFIACALNFVDLFIKSSTSSSIGDRYRFCFINRMEAWLAQIPIWRSKLIFIQRCWIL